VQTDRNEHSNAFLPATVAGIVAAVGTAGFIFLAFGPGSAIDGRGDGMRTVAAVYSAGATISPTDPTH
jgi:hypothetical protein